MSNKKFDKYKNLLLITDVNFPYGGASANLLRLFTKGMAESGYDIHVILQKGKQFGSNKDQKSAGIINKISFSHCCFANRPVNYILKIIDDICGIIFPSFYILKYRITNELDYVIMYNSNALFSFLNLLICKMISIPIINIVVEWYEKENEVSKSPLKSFKRYFSNLQLKILNKKFTGLVVLSNFLKNYYIKNGLSENKILVQPNFVDFADFSNIKIKNKGNLIRIGYCGTPTRKDGIIDLLKAFCLVHCKHINTELIIIGDNTGNKSLIPQLKEKIEGLGLGNNIILTGLVDTKEIPPLLHSCDILVLARPSGMFAEAGFPTKLGEYMACKKPVVITKVGDIPLYLKDAVSAMLAEPDNPQSVADKIIFLIETPDKAKLIGEEGYNWANETLEYRNAAKNIIEFIEKLNDRK